MQEKGSGVHPNLIYPIGLLPLKDYFYYYRFGVPSNQREPLFFKRRKSDIFYSKKYAMSLIRTIFAFGNGREAKQQSFELLR